jgi:glycine cleavage system aminomethyltransferase T
MGAPCTPWPATKAAASSTTSSSIASPADHFLIVVNASNIDKDYQHFVANVGSLCQISNESDSTALIAFQGPKAANGAGPADERGSGNRCDRFFLP